MTTGFTFRKALLLIAVILFALAGIGVTFGANISFVAIGLAFFAGSFLVEG